MIMDTDSVLDGDSALLNSAVGQTYLQGNAHTTTLQNMYKRIT